MKKLLLSALILLCCISQSAAWMNVTTVGGGVPAAAGDAEIVYYFNCDSDTTTQTPTKGTGDVAVGADATTIAGVVSNGLDNNNTTATAYITIPVGSAGQMSWSVGTIGFYFHPFEAASGYVLFANGDAIFSFSYSYDTTYTYKYRNVSRTCTIETDSTYFIEIAWDADNTRMALRCGGGSWSELTNATGTAPSASALAINGTFSSAVDGWVDQIIVSNVYQKDIFSIKDNTSF